ncbi:MAG: NADH-quinone oxidoreductase subunit H, partial [Zetaproteobacteria bacterium]
MSWTDVVAWLAEIVALAVIIALSVAYTTYFERRIIGWMQVRKGCNRVGPAGLLQPIADMLKLILKETIIPHSADKKLFVLAPVVAVAPALLAYAAVPFGETKLFGLWDTPHRMVIADLNVGVLYVMAVSSMTVYGMLLAGWSSNTKYAFLGTMRSTCQTISYEIAMGFALVPVMMLAGSLNLSEIVEAQKGGFWHWYWIPLFPMFLV